MYLIKEGFTIKRLSILIMLVFMMTLSTGCNIWTGSIEGLLSPPKLTTQQQEIYQALTSSIDTKISLKYPRTGDYLSAFIVANFDDEPSDEAIVFYEKTGITADETSLRINVLDQENGKWKSIFDKSADGSEVDTVIISKLGQNDDVSIIVGYNMMQGEKQLNIYKYVTDAVSGNRQLVETLSDTYSIMSVQDIDNDSYNELFLVTGNSASSYAEAKILKVDNNSKYVRNRVAMDYDVIDYIQCLYSNPNDDTSKQIFIDSILTTNIIETEILYFNTSDGNLIISNSSNDEREILGNTVRPSGYNSCDIDNDGIIEIPTITTFTGYEKLSDTEQLQMTKWLTYQNKSLVVKYEGYYSITDGYFFALPERWKNKVTIKLDNARNDMVFYEYNETLEDSTVELLRLTVSEEKNMETIQNNGYQLMRTNNGKCYFAKVFNNVNSELEISLAEVLFNLKFNS